MEENYRMSNCRLNQYRLYFTYTKGGDIFEHII